MAELIRALTGMKPTPGFNAPNYGEIPFSVVIPAGVGAVVTGNIVIDATYDFAFFAKMAKMTATDFDVELTYPDGTRMQSGPTKGDLVFGEPPFSLPLNPGYLCPKGSRIGYRFVNRTGAAITVDGVLIGDFIRPSA